jgi:Protein of unknown function (DUF998)
MATLLPGNVTATPGSRRPVAAVVVALLIASAATVALAPLMMPGSYSWIRQVVSDTASQGIEGAWLGRMGFVLSATAILLLSGVAGSAWNRWGRLLHQLYGFLLLVLAVFSRRPWAGVSFDRKEDEIHTVIAIVAGVVFTVAVVLVALSRRPASRLARVTDWGTVTAMLVLPLVMLAAISVAGVTERVMVAFGLSWYTLEAVRFIKPGRL